MPRINAGDAGKRQTNASKAFSERKLAVQKAWPPSRVGGLLVGGRRQTEQGPGALLAIVQGRSGVRFLRDPADGEQQRRQGRESRLHVQAIHRGRVPAVWPQALERIDRRHVGADRSNSRRAGGWAISDEYDPARAVAGFSRPESTEPFFQPGVPSEVVSERDLQACHVGWSHSEQSGGGT